MLRIAHNRQTSLPIKAVRKDEDCGVRWPSQLHRRRSSATHHTDYSVTPWYVWSFVIFFFYSYFYPFFCYFFLVHETVIPFCFIQSLDNSFFIFEYKYNLVLELIISTNQTDNPLLEGLLSSFHRKTLPPPSIIEPISLRFDAGKEFSHLIRTYSRESPIARVVQIWLPTSTGFSSSPTFIG